MHETRTGIGVSDWRAPPGFVLRQSSAIVAIARTRMGSAGKSLWAASEVWKGGSWECSFPQSSVKTSAHRGTGASTLVVETGLPARSPGLRNILWDAIGDISALF